jgi:hypothetical protein
MILESRKNYRVILLVVFILKRNIEIHPRGNYLESFSNFPEQPQHPALEKSFTVKRPAIVESGCLSFKDKPFTDQGEFSPYTKAD